LGKDFIKIDEETFLRRGTEVRMPGNNGKHLHFVLGDFNEDVEMWEVCSIHAQLSSPGQVLFYASLDTMIDKGFEICT